MKRLRHPIRAIREPFGTAGLVVASIALIAAMGGTAFAATKLNSGQKKEVEKIAKKFAGKPGAPGSNGANGTSGTAGPKGDAGSPGANGTNGTNGINGKSVETGAATVAECAEGGATVQVAGEAATKKKVCNGKEGKEGKSGFTEVLPSGKTETGVWAGSGFNVAEFAQVEFPISFAIPLNEPGKAVFLNEKTTKSGTEIEKKGCTGTVSVPTAPAGFLCIYTAEEEFSTGFVQGGVVFNKNVEGYDRTGTALRFQNQGAEAESRFEGNGSWAVTAP